MSASARLARLRVAKALFKGRLAESHHFFVLLVRLREGIKEVLSDPGQLAGDLTSAGNAHQRAFHEIWSFVPDAPLLLHLRGKTGGVEADVPRVLNAKVGCSFDG